MYIIMSQTESGSWHTASLTIFHSRLDAYRTAKRMKPPLTEYRIAYLGKTPDDWSIVR